MSSSPGTSGAIKRVKLPSHAIPTSYKLNLTPNFDTFKFEGEVHVSLKVNQALDFIEFHAHELTTSLIEYIPDGGSAIKSSEQSSHEKNQTIRAKFPSDIPVGTGVLHVVYTGIHNDQMAGFYRSKYTVKGEERWMVTTQFEATDARRAFPCWDEPAHKATFDLTLSAPKNRTALSNMPVKSTKPVIGKSDWVSYTFDTTPKMSTYLLAFIVGEFEYIEGSTAEGVSVKVYTPLGKSEQGRFALEAATKTISFFNEYFAIPYPLPKSDLVAIPDFAAGAMENWGLVTYREVALLVDPAHSSEARKQQIGITVCHELAHQWFGNLVTMEWWNNLWLNEGFATWVSYLAVDKLYPHWDIWTQFLVDDLGRALKLDALESSHPIQVDIAHSSQIDEIFDAISYSKGASVIQMLYNWLGFDAFRSGLREYLKTHAYANTVTEDLWKALGKASGKPVLQVMSMWTQQTGYPYLSVEAAGPNGIPVRQQRFLSKGPNPDDKTLWHIPVALTSASDPKATWSELITSASTTIPLDGAHKNAQWVKLNCGQAGVYRVSYSPKAFEGLKVAIKSGSLSSSDRYGLIDDTWALTRAGVGSTTDFLNLLSAYTSSEKDYTVWSAITGGLDELLSVFSSSVPRLSLESDADLKNLKAFVRKSLGPIWSSVGWDKKPDEHHLDQMLRPKIVSLLAASDDETVVATALKKFEAYKKSSSSLEPNLRGVVFSIVAAKSGASGYDDLLSIYKKSDNIEERVKALYTLSQATDPVLIQKYLEMSLTDDVRRQDILYVVRGLAGNSSAIKQAWTWIKNNWDALKKRFEDGSFLFQSIAGAIPKKFSTAEDLKDVKAFFEIHKTTGIERTVSQTLESIESNAAWMSREKATISKWLA